MVRKFSGLVSPHSGCTQVHRAVCGRRALNDLRCDGVDLDGLDADGVDRLFQPRVSGSVSRRVGPFCSWPAEYPGPWALHSDRRVTEHDGPVVVVVRSRVGVERNVAGVSEQLAAEVGLLGVKPTVSGKPHNHT